jgi:hypothetical protein
MRETFLSISSLAEILLWRDGGQRQARRNAWASMVVDSARARARADAETAVLQQQQATAKSAPIRNLASL